MLEDFRIKIYEKLHNQPYGTEKVINEKDINIPYAFTRVQPNEWKMERARKLYREKGFVDKPILVKKIVKKNGRITYIIKDNYTRFLVLKEIHMDKIPIMIMV